MGKFKKAAAFVVSAVVPLAGLADVVKLKSGGEIRGVLVEDDAEAGDDQTLTVETLSGGRLTVLQSDVQFVTRRPRNVEEYEVKAKTTPDTVDAQWDLAEWCRLNRLEEQRQVHLQRIVEIDYDHADARRALGQRKFEGDWLTREQIMAERGLVEHKGKWLTPQEVELIEKTEAEREAEHNWYLKIRKLRMNLAGGNENLRQKAIVELKRIRDPNAVNALAKNFGDLPDPSLRIFYLSILSEIPGIKPVQPLVTQSLHDVDESVRKFAFEAITPARSEAALPYLLQGLRHANNDVVRRAAKGLEAFGDERVISDLIPALITTHRHRVQVPEAVPTISFSSGGAFGPGGTPLPPEIDAALRVGALPHGVKVNSLNPVPVRMRTVEVRINQENAEVLSALRKITGETFGYDERTWRLWWAAKKNGVG